ncbi:MAG: hypothetical protein AAF400_01075 [Bacteroidota bacterium]
MIFISNLTYHVGARTLYNGASLLIKPKDKIGLVGVNGTVNFTQAHSRLLAAHGGWLWMEVTNLPRR